MFLPQEHAVLWFIDYLCIYVRKELNTSLILQYRTVSLMVILVDN